MGQWSAAAHHGSDSRRRQQQSHEAAGPVGQEVIELGAAAVGESGLCYLIEDAEHRHGGGDAGHAAECEAMAARVGTVVVKSYGTGKASHHDEVDNLINMRYQRQLVGADGVRRQRGVDNHGEAQPRWPVSAQESEEPRHQKSFLGLVA